MRVKIRTVIAVAAVMLAGVSASAQDLLARQAPIDKKMKAIDSISLRRMFLDKNAGSPLLNLENPSGDIYPEWNNKRGRTYGVAMPKEYNIDLRHFCMPCDSRVVTSHYGYRPAFGRNHYGTDIKVYVGDTIRSAFSGKVRIVAYEAKGYGNYVIVRHENGLETVYGHMSKHLVKENQSVRAGEPIGLGGNTGRSTGSHLHFETRFLGEYINPELLFDFGARDVKGDYYVYRSSGKSNVVGNSHHADPAPVLASSSRREENVAKVESAAASTSKAEKLAAENAKAEKKAAAEKAKAEKEKASKAKKEKEAAKKEKESKRSVHSVKSGDTLYGIARKYNTTVDKLCKINHISETAVLRPGQVLKCS